MSLVRFTTEGQDELWHLFGKYSQSNPSDTGEERLQKFLILFAKFNSDLKTTRRKEQSTDELEHAFLKELVTLAYREYCICWKKKPVLCSEVLNFVGERLQFTRKIVKTKPLDPRAIHHFSADTLEESDKSYFLRIYERFSSPIISNQRLPFWTVGTTVTNSNISASTSPVARMGYRSQE